MELVPGNEVHINSQQRAGAQAKSKLAMLNPADSIVDWVLKTVPTMGAGWCPPGMLGIGIGGTAEGHAIGQTVFDGGHRYPNVD